MNVTVSCGATYAPKKLWGFADVDEDGSAAFQVPSEVPIYFMALDAEGRALQRMRSFTHLMPGEVQGCVGCHADRNAATPSGIGGFNFRGDSAHSPVQPFSGGEKARLALAMVVWQKPNLIPALNLHRGNHQKLRYPHLYQRHRPGWK